LQTLREEKTDAKMNIKCRDGKAHFGNVERYFFSKVALLSDPEVYEREQGLASGRAGTVLFAKPHAVGPASGS
jgi:hypothetical protein